MSDKTSQRHGPSEERGADAPVILVVEDDEPIAEALSLVLEDAGYRPIWVAGGRQALEAAREHWPALVLTDMMMPRMDGAELIKALCALAAAEGHIMPPVVLMTAAGVGARRAEDLGIDAVVTKPFDVYALEVLVTRLITRM